MRLPRGTSSEVLEHTCSRRNTAKHGRLPSAAGGAADSGKELVLADLPLCGATFPLLTNQLQPLEHWVSRGLELEGSNSCKERACFLFMKHCCVYTLDYV